MSAENEAMIFNSSRTTDLQVSQRDEAWKKAVKINPPHAVIFKEVGDDGKSVSQLEITNHSQGYIIFKVSMHSFMTSVEPSVVGEDHHAEQLHRETQPRHHCSSEQHHN